MRKQHCAFMKLLFFIILTIFVGTSVGITARAQQRKKSSAKKAISSKKGKALSRVAVQRGKSTTRSSKFVAGKSSRRRGRESQVSSTQHLLRKGGKLTRAERMALASSSRRRSRARYLARLRALQARDSALRNIASANILRDDDTG